ncbi:hypothetical protein HNE05_17395 [Aquipseudomonas campi]|uniref:Uncharacterized protein n=1 Tax=Aquipseudomonas campi TaxID=2731681 RepID=A0A6M8FCM3_9GAMM|nr:hypothetical protein [Pseudomonas campi]QKE65051.1 hypothetical protein HNE05_17395 [Pseudomonas campi]
MERLEIGQRKDGIEVNSALRWNRSGIRVMSGEHYQVQASLDIWRDASIPSDANGQAGSALQNCFKWLIRCKAATWFQLVAALGESDKQLFPLGLDAHLNIPDGTDAELTLFANDVSLAYGNNRGSVWVSLTRLA